MSALTEAEQIVMDTLARYPNGAPITGKAGKEAVLSLAAKVLVCDPHTMGDALFTRLTDAGLASLNQGSGQ